MIKKLSKYCTKHCVVCQTPVSRYESQFRGKHTYCSFKCKGIHQKEILKGSNNPCWRGGKYIETYKGYILIRMPDHPRARKSGYVLEHILVAEEMLERPLNNNESVHHIDGNKQNNKPENLKIFPSNSEHHHLAHPRDKKPPCLCGKPHKGHGLCSRHLSQLRKTGETWDFENKYLEPQKIGEIGQHSSQRITICPCGRKVHARGLCTKHYQQWRKKKEIAFD